MCNACRGKGRRDVQNDVGGYGGRHGHGLLSVAVGAGSPVRPGAPQRYGSQLTCRDGRWILLTVDDPNGLDARRAAVGLEPIADYLARIESTGDCG